MTVKPDKQILDEWQRNPANWKLGIFYYNSQDKRVLPPKRYGGLGWTVNFAYPYSIMLFLALIVGIFLIGYFF